MLFNVPCFLLLGICLTLNAMHAEAFIFGYITQFFDGLIFGRRCYEHLGCFYNGPPFYHWWWRPISLLPDKVVNTDFLLYTPSTKDKPYKLKLTKASVVNSTYEAKLTTKILIPGYLTNLPPDDIFFALKNRLFDNGDYNIIIVDWGRYNNFPYSKASPNGRVVGAQVAYLLQLIKENKGMDYRSVHMMGHSLGAHVCGWTGERINKIGRITGMDPAGPYFREAPPAVRLDRSDAIFVDIIHSDLGNMLREGLGLDQDIGHQDFYPNGGSQQPACNNNRTFLQYIGVTADPCDHFMAVKYFKSSFKDCMYNAVQCKSYAAFENRECTRKNSAVTQMGYRAKKLENPKEPQRFYLDTSAKPPYCAVEV